MEIVESELVEGRRPRPEPGPGEIEVHVTAAGVNRADLLQRMGFYPPPPGASDIPGLEVSGRDPGGEAVCALLTGGGYAEQVSVPIGQVMPIPSGVGLVEAAALPEVACTVYSNLAMTAALQPGELVLIHGGGSGIGTFAIQWAKAIGARVAVTVGSAEKARACSDLGADVVINYRARDFAEELRGQADVILDIIGAKYLAANLRALAIGGRMVTIGLQGGVKAELNLGLLLAKRGSLHATALRSRSLEEKALICRDVVDNVWPLVAAGHIRPVVDRILPLAEAASAHRVLEEGSAIGKILLTTGA